MENKDRNFKVIIISVSLILLLASLTQEAYYVTGMKASIGSFGLIAFLLGWLDIVGPGIVWLANPLLIFSWFALRSGKDRRALILSLMAVLCSLSFLLLKKIVINEAGMEGEIIAYGNGYKLWLSSCLLNLLGNLTIYLDKKISPSK